MNQWPGTAKTPDPLFLALRGRHPSVDVVLLGAPLPPGKPVADEVVARVRREVECFARELWERSTRSTQDFADSSAFGFRYGGTPDRVQPEIRCRVERPDGAEVVARFADDLAAAGWQITRPAGGFSPVRGTRHSIDVLVTHLDPPGAVLMRVRGPVVAVGVMRAVELTRSEGS